MHSTSGGRKTWAKPSPKSGPFGTSERLDIVFASEPESPKSPPEALAVPNEVRNRSRSPGMTSFYGGRRFLFENMNGGGDGGEGDENSIVDSTQNVFEAGSPLSASTPLSKSQPDINANDNLQKIDSPRQTWDVFIHETQPKNSGKNNTKAVRSIIQAWREKEQKSFHNMAAGDSVTSPNYLNEVSTLPTRGRVHSRQKSTEYSTSSLPHKRTLSSSIDQLNSIFDTMQAVDSSESDSQDGSVPPRGSLGYYKACATPQINRKFPAARSASPKKTVTFMDHKSGKVTPTRRRDRSNDGGQRNRLFESTSGGNGNSVGKQSQPVIHPMFRTNPQTQRRTSMENFDTTDLNDSIDSGVVVGQENGSKTVSVVAPSRQLKQTELRVNNVPVVTDGPFKVNLTCRSPPPMLNLNDDGSDDDTEETVETTSNPFKTVLEQWRSNLKQPIKTEESDAKANVSSKGTSSESTDSSSYQDDDSEQRVRKSSVNDNVFYIEKPAQFISNQHQSEKSSGVLSHKPDILSPKPEIKTSKPAILSPKPDLKSDIGSKDTKFSFDTKEIIEHSNEIPAENPVNQYEVSPSLLNEFSTNQSTNLEKTYEASPSLINEFPTRLNKDPSSNAQIKSTNVEIKAMEKPIDEDIEFPMQVQDKISMFEIKRPKQPNKPKINTGRKLPKPPVKTTNDVSPKTPIKTTTHSEQKKLQKRQLGSMSKLSSMSCTDIFHATCDSTDSGSNPDYDSRSLPRSRPKLRSNQVTKIDTNRARSRTPNAPRSTVISAKKEPASASKYSNTSKGQIEAMTSHKGSPRSTSASVVANAVSQINKSKVNDPKTQNDSPRSRSLSSSTILSAPVPFTPAKPPKYGHVSINANKPATSSSPKKSIPAEKPNTSANKPFSSYAITGTASSKISRSRRKMPETPGGNASDSSSSGRKTPDTMSPPRSVGRQTPELFSSKIGRRTPDPFIAPSGRKTPDSSFLRSGRKTPDTALSSGRKTPEPVQLSDSKRFISKSTISLENSGRRTPDNFLMERNRNVNKSATVRRSPSGTVVKGSFDNAPLEGEPDGSSDVVYVPRSSSQPTSFGNNSISSSPEKAEKSSSGSIQSSVSGTRRKLPNVSALTTQRKLPDPAVIQKSSSGRAFPDTGDLLAARRQDYMQRRAETQQIRAQRLYNRILPSTPGVTTNNRSRTLSGSSAHGDDSPSRTSNDVNQSPSRQTSANSGNSARQISGVSGNTNGQTSGISGSATRQSSASPSPARLRSKAMSPSPSRARSPWQQMLASRMNKPKQSFSALGRSITRSLTPSKELLDQMDYEDKYGANVEPSVPLLRGRSEPNIAGLFNVPPALSPVSLTNSDLANNNAKSAHDNTQSSTTMEQLNNTARRPSLSHELEGEDNEIQAAFSPAAERKPKRRDTPRKPRRRTVGGVPTMSEIQRSQSPAPKVMGTTVSERFLRLSQGDLSAPTGIMDELIRDPPKHQGVVRRSSSMRSLNMDTAEESIWSDEAFEAREGDAVDESRPTKVVRDDRKGLVGYVFNV